MTLGLTVSLLVTFLLLPVFNQSFASDNEIGLKDTEKSFITSALCSFTKKNKIIIFGSTFNYNSCSFVGISKLEVENSFINYFDKDTEIYKGMKKIDERFGRNYSIKYYFEISINVQKSKSENDEFDEWEEENKTNDEEKSKYWFTRDKMDKIIKVHDYLDLYQK